MCYWCSPSIHCKSPSYDAVYDGNTYHFCSTSCRFEFVKNRRESVGLEVARLSNEIYKLKDKQRELNKYYYTQ